MANEPDPTPEDHIAQPNGSGCRKIHFEDGCAEDPGGEPDCRGPNVRRFAKRSAAGEENDRVSGRVSARQSEINDAMDGKTDVQLKKLQRCRNVITWLFLFVAGMLTGLTALLVIHVVEKVVHWRTERAAHAVEAGNVGQAMVEFVLISTSLIMFGCTILVLKCPAAAGSGIVEVKAYLNGNRAVESAFSMNALLCRVVGIITSVGGGLTVGMEGPFVRVGTALSYQTRNALNHITPMYHNDSKFDLLVISSGAAAGLAAAFGVPIGGMLFAAEAASYWSRELMLTSLFIAIVADFIKTYAYRRIMHGEWNTPIMDTASINVFRTGEQSYYSSELAAFAFLGVLGGLLGSYFSIAQVVMDKYRKKHYGSRKKIFSLLECLVVALVTSLSLFLTAFGGQCHAMNGEVAINGTASNSSATALIGTGRQMGLDLHLMRWNCGEDEYNDVASLLHTTHEGTLSILFTQGDSSEFVDLITPGSLWLVASVYFTLSVFSYGLKTSTGIYMPGMIVGAA